MHSTRSAQILTDTQIRLRPAELEHAWESKPTFALVPEHTPVSREWLAQALVRLPDAWQRDHFALLTSGSTGQPRLVVGSRARAESLARLLDRVQLGSDALATVVALPLTYCYAFVNQWLWARVLGRVLIPTGGFGDPQGLVSALRAVDQGMLCLVGAQVPLLRRSVAGGAFPGIIRLHFAGGAFPQDELAFLAGRFPNALIFNNYGCTEAMPRLTLRRADEAREGANIGRTLPGVELRAAPDGRLLFRSPYGAVGIVDAAGVHVIAAGDWIETGDLGAQAADGSWLLAGRSNEVFKRYGEKVSLTQVLECIGAAWQGEAGVYRERDRNGEDGAVLVLAPVPAADELQGVLRALRNGFPRPHWPLRIEALGAIARLPNGKVEGGRLAQAGAQIVWRQRI